MFGFTVLVLLISFYEIYTLKKKNKKKEIYIYIFFSVITLAFGYFYLSDPYRKSFSMLLLEIEKALF